MHDPAAGGEDLHRYVESGHGDSSFGPAEHYVVNTTPFAVALADLNGDGRLDLNE
jgi:hypothetical protein